MEAKKLNNLSVEEYLKIEANSEEKYEYYDGVILAMAGGTLNHGLICGNIFGEFRTILKNKKRNCKAINSEIKLHISSKNAFLYPDAMVICGDIKKSSVNPNAVTNPLVIVEVLSKSTANYDRGDKFFLYKQIEILQEYILIEQEKAQIDIYERKSDLWKITRVLGLQNDLEIHSLGIKIPLTDIYQDITFSKQE